MSAVSSSAVSSFVFSVECDHVSTACLFCTDDRPVELFGHDWGDLAWGPVGLTEEGRGGTRR